MDFYFQAQTWQADDSANTKNYNLIFFLLTYWAVAVQHKSTDDDLFDKDEGLEFICSAYLYNKYPGVGVSPVDRPRCKVRYCW